MTDAQRQEQLKREAERLNPDSWSSSDDVRQALEQYEAVFASFRDVLGRHRRRSSGGAAAERMDTSRATGAATEDGAARTSTGEETLTEAPDASAVPPEDSQD